MLSAFFQMYWLDNTPFFHVFYLRNCTCFFLPISFHQEACMKFKCELKLYDSNENIRYDRVFSKLTQLLDKGFILSLGILVLL